MADNPAPAGLLTVTLREVAAVDDSDDDLWLSAIGPKAMWLARLIRGRHLETLGIEVPDGFVITGEAYELHRSAAWPAAGSASGIPQSLAVAITTAATELAGSDGRLVVRSSASVEDTSRASFAGEFVSVLDVEPTDEVLSAYSAVTASLGTDAVAEACRLVGVDPDGVLMPVLVQRMIPLEDSIGGVMLTSHPTGSRTVTLIEAAAGGAVGVVSGTRDPQTIVLDNLGAAQVGLTDEFSTHVDGEALIPVDVTRKLYHLAGLAEALVGQRAEIEWVWVPSSGVLYLLQVRPLVDPRRSTNRSEHRAGPGELLTSGLGVGSGSVSAAVLTPSTVEEAMELCSAPELADGFVLVVPTTSPEWLPIIRLASAVVTDTGGRTSHAAIVCRELGIPAVVGCGDAVEVLGAIRGEVTVSIDLRNGQGRVFSTT